jgi:thioredoxin
MMRRVNLLKQCGRFFFAALMVAFFINGFTPASQAADKTLPRLLDLGATKCIPCKMMAPILDELERDLAGQLEVEFIDVWENRGKAGEYGIQMIPTQIFFSPSGEELYRHAGFYSRKDILNKWRELGYSFDIK